MSKWLIAVFPLAIVVAFGAMAAGAESQYKQVFSYSSLQSGEQLVIDMDSEAMSFGDVVLSFEKCRLDSQYFCIHNETFKFAVPRDSSHLLPKHLPIHVLPHGKSEKDVESHKTKWSVGGQVYKLLSPLTKQHIFGKKGWISCYSIFTCR